MPRRSRRSQTPSSSSRSISSSLAPPMDAQPLDELAERLGLDPADPELIRQALASLFGPRLDALAAIAGAPKSAKSRLQEWTQRHHGTKPVYQLAGTSGPPHEQNFRVIVTLDGRSLGTGSGSSRQRAEEQAAQMALGELHAGRVPTA